MATFHMGRYGRIRIVHGMGLLRKYRFGDLYFTKKYPAMGFFIQMSNFILQSTEKIETMIHQEMVRLNDFIYDGERHAPEIHFSNTRRGTPTYTFGCKWNKGTGKNYKNMIIYDLSILKITELPFLIHDSLVFKNVADLPIDKIMKLYGRSPKQIFIAFDKQSAYTKFTASTVNNTKVLELHDNGGELFGWSWAKK